MWSNSFKCLYIWALLIKGCIVSLKWHCHALFNTLALLICFPIRFMIKRAQGRNRFGMKNFKKRWFRLTNHEFTYHKTKGEVRRLMGALHVPFSVWVSVDGSAGDGGAATDIEFSRWHCGCNDSVNNMTSDSSAGTKTILNKQVLIMDLSDRWKNCGMWTISGLGKYRLFGAAYCSFSSQHSF